MEILFVAAVAAAGGAIAGVALMPQNKSATTKSSVQVSEPVPEVAQYIQVDGDEEVVIHFGLKADSGPFEKNGVAGISLRGGSFIRSNKNAGYHIEAVPVAINGNPYGKLEIGGEVFGCVGDALVKITAGLNTRQGTRLMDELQDALDDEGTAQIVLVGSLVESKSQRDPAKGFHGKQVKLLRLESWYFDAKLVRPGETGFIQPGIEGKKADFRILPPGRTKRNPEPVKAKAKGSLLTAEISAVEDTGVTEEPAKLELTGDDLDDICLA